MSDAPVVEPSFSSASMRFLMTVLSRLSAGGTKSCSTTSRINLVQAAQDSRIEEEVPLNWNKWVRQTHRWLSIAFTVAVIINTIAVGQGRYTVWVGLLALLPLALLLFTGLYLFVLPYATKWRSGRRTG